MVKFSILIGFSYLLFHSLNQFIPQPPIQISTRTVSSQTFEQDFVSGFCQNCDRNSSQCKFNLDTVQRIPEIKFSLKNITNNPYGIKSAAIVIDQVKINHKFKMYELKDAKMKYVLYMPYPEVKTIKGVVMYFHPTLFGISEIPTNAPTQVSSIAALYVSSAYAIIFINYLGYQFGDVFPHPYVIFPTVNIESAILSLNKALTLLKSTFQSNKIFNLYTVGYSQGAAYALWFEKCVKYPEICQTTQLDSSYNYNGAAGLDGPYDLSTTVKRFLVENVKKSDIYKIKTQLMTNFAKPPLMSMTLISYVYFVLGQSDYQDKMNSSFWKMQCTSPLDPKNCTVSGTQYDNIFQAIKSRKKSLDIAQSISFSALAKNYKEYKEKYLGTSTYQYMKEFNNSIFSLASQQLINSEEFDQILQKSSAINNSPTKKVFVFSLQQDSMVSVRNTQNYVHFYGRNKVESYYFSNIFHLVCSATKIPQISQVDHNGGQVLANLFSLAFINKIESGQI